jgi:RNA polymerase sigma-70 factor (ECF subfamily)
MDIGTNPLAGLSYNKRGNSAAPVDDDSDLVARSRHGDLEAFEQLVLMHQKRMLNIAYRLIGDYDDACEVVQDAFVSAHRNIKTFRGDSKFTTWLTAITMNLSKNRLKHLKSRQGHVAYSLDDQVETSEGEMAIDPLSKAPSALDQLELRDVQSRVQDCIKMLDPDFREVLVLRDLQDLSYEEIGSLLNLQSGTVKSRLFRAREIVKDCLKHVMGGL